MKRFLLAFCMASLMIGFEADAAVVKCVKKPSGPAQSDVSAQNNYFDWRGTFGGVAVRGMAVCSSNSTPVDGAGMHLGSKPGRYCFCRMIYPAVSKYVAMGAMGGSVATDYETCIENCAPYCAETMKDASFVNTLFGSLLD